VKDPDDVWEAKRGCHVQHRISRVTVPEFLMKMQFVHPKPASNRVELGLEFASQLQIARSVCRAIVFRMNGLFENKVLCRRKGEEQKRGKKIKEPLFEVLTMTT
jgi:hypothetical protein